MSSAAPNKITPSDYMPMVQEQANMNRFNVNTPFGSLKYTNPTYRDMPTPGANNEYGRQIETPGSIDFAFDPSLTDTSVLEKAMFDKQMRLLQPEYARQGAALEQSLANRGLPSGSEAFTDETSLFRRNQDEALQQAANQSVMAGEATRGQRLGQAMQMLGFQPTPVDITGAAGLAQSANNAQSQANANAKGGATQLGSTAILASMFA